jgi:hypothetical protein
MLQTRSDFNWDIVDTNVIYIEDLDLGRMSVTNDIERVCAFIRDKLNVTEERMRNYCIFYKDSDGDFTGVDYKEDDLISYYGIPEALPTVKEVSQWVQHRCEALKRKGVVK